MQQHMRNGERDLQGSVYPHEALIFLQGQALSRVWFCVYLWRVEGVWEFHPGSPPAIVLAILPHDPSN